MIIKDLNLISFGKYENKTVSLKDGLNIIYGENESGKTTIHSFINGMFYGFLRPYVKSTLYTEEHKKYEPWHFQRYAGIIYFDKDGELYRIERDFTKGKEDTKVLIENTGEDITYTIDNGNNGRVLQPGTHFFGFNSVTFSNTVSIKQLGSRTDDKLADEVKDKLVNVTTALEDDISIEKALKDLDKSLKDIGTFKAPTSLYGTTYAKTSRLEEHLQEALKTKEEYDRILEENRVLKLQLDGLQDKLEGEKQELRKSQYMDLKNIYNEAVNIIDYIKDRDASLIELEYYKDLSREDYSKAITMENDLNILHNKLEESGNTLEELKAQIKAKKERIAQDNQESTDTIAANKKHVIQYNILLTLIVIIYIGSIFVFRKSLTNLLLTQLLILPLVFIFRSSKEKNRLIERIKLQEESMKLELQSIYDAEEKLKNLQDRVDKLNIEKQEKNLSLASIYEKNKSFNMADFKNNIDKRNLYLEISLDLDNKRELLQRILGKYNLNQLKEYLKANANLISDKTRNEDEIRESIDFIQQEITNTSLTKKGLEERLSILAPIVSNIVNIKEELSRCRNLTEELDKRKEAIQLAKSTIADLSKEIHSQFAPEINKKVGSIIREITDNKYSSVRIDSNLDIGVIDNNTGELIKVDSLSGGTIDQLYFSLRFGIIGSIKTGNLPLILDDCFIQYDDKRLEKVLQFLIQVSRCKQVILFSCQNREKEILEKMNENFNLITLS